MCLFNHYSSLLVLTLPLFLFLFSSINLNDNGGIVHYSHKIASFSSPLKNLGQQEVLNKKSKGSS